MSREKYASPARLKLWVSWIASERLSASLVVGLGLNSGVRQPRPREKSVGRSTDVKMANRVDIGKLSWRERIWSFQIRGADDTSRLRRCDRSDADRWRWGGLEWFVRVSGAGWRPAQV